MCGVLRWIVALLGVLVMVAVALLTHNPIYSVQAHLTIFLVGLVYALMYMKTKDIRIVIAVHFAANFIGRIIAFVGQ